MRKLAFSSRPHPSRMPTAEEFVAAIRNHLANGVRHESIAGVRLTTAKEVLEVLVRDGCVFVCEPAGGEELN